MSEKKLVFLGGAPNSGKSSTCSVLCTSSGGGSIISPGNWLRTLMSGVDNDNPTPQNDLANYLSNNWNNEVLEPIVMHYVDERIEEQLSAAAEKLILVEGYPRTLIEAQNCLKWATKLPVWVVLLDVSFEELSRRAKKRQRFSDDGEASMKTRFEYWKKHSEVIFETCAPLSHRIQVADGESIEDVCQKIRLILSGNPAIPVIPVIPVIPPATPPIAIGATEVSSFFSIAKPLEKAQIVQMQLRLAKCSKRKRQFVGSHPVSLSRELMPRLLRYPYLCSLKIDGTRLMCLVRDSSLWFVNRKLDVWRGPTLLKELAPFNDTLIDGELVGDNLFYVIDALCVAGRDVSQRPIIERLAHTVPLGRLFFNGPFRFRSQEYVDRTQLQSLMDRSSTRPFKVDGIIFQPAKLPVRQGIDYNLFKWKPAEHNTVDLLWGEDERLYVRKTSEKTTDDDVAVVDKDAGVMLAEVSHGKMHPLGVEAEISPGSVVECSIVREEDGEGFYWMPQRIRNDKMFPNMDWVVESIIKSIEDNIGAAELVTHCQLPPVAPTSVPSPPRIRRAK